MSEKLENIKKLSSLRRHIENAVVYILHHKINMKFSTLLKDKEIIMILSLLSILFI